MQFGEPEISDKNVKNILVTQIPKGIKAHYAIFQENYFVVDDILKKSTAQRAVGWVIIYEILCDSRVCAFGYKCHKTYYLKILSENFAFKNRT